MLDDKLYKDTKSSTRGSYSILIQSKSGIFPESIFPPYLVINAPAFVRFLFYVLILLLMQRTDL